MTACAENVKTHLVAGVDGRWQWEQQGLHQHLHNGGSRVQVDHASTNSSFLCGQTDSRDAVTHTRTHAHTHSVKLYISAGRILETKVLQSINYGLCYAGLEQSGILRILVLGFMVALPCKIYAANSQTKYQAWQLSHVNNLQLTSIMVALPFKIQAACSSGR